MNTLGQIEVYLLGNEYVRMAYDSYYRLSDISYNTSEESYDLAYTYYANSGNLETRFNNYSDITEKFYYDALNRLTDAYHNNVLAYKTSFDNNGNILSKTNAGYYKYDPARESAVEQISTEAFNSDGTTVFPEIPTNISTNAQDITYTWLLIKSSQEKVKYFWLISEVQVRSL